MTTLPAPRDPDERARRQFAAPGRWRARLLAGVRRARRTSTRMPRLSGGCWRVAVHARAVQGALDRRVSARWRVVARSAPPRRSWMQRLAGALVGGTWEAALPLDS
ncbi:hypothetical protein [Paracoccus pacificus]|uniref:Uncharacterized protein n=1 Tax=Paracoccus pacificus TaxID=1463598 RepID=A0ABW4R986_9RHOB